MSRRYYVQYFDEFKEWGIADSYTHTPEYVDFYNDYEDADQACNVLNEDEEWNK